MTVVYVTIPDPPGFPIVDAITGDPLWAQVRGKAGDGTAVLVEKEPREPAMGRWPDAIRALTLDPRFEELTDIYERNEFRHALTRAKPGEVVPIDMKLRDAIRECVLKPRTLTPAFLYSGGAEMLRALLDAPSTKPTKTEA